MKTAKIATIGTASLFAMIALLLAYPAMANTSGDTSIVSGQTTTTASQAALPSTAAAATLSTGAALTAGQTITFTSTNGTFRTIDGASQKTGAASGTMTLMVTGVYGAGYALSITSGTLRINGTSYSITSGSAQMGEHQAHLVGQGSFGNSAGSFLMVAGAHTNFQGKSFNTLRFDIQVNGVAEYGLVLVAGAQVS
jgi:hypothetical protein